MDEGQFLESIVATLLRQNPGMSPEEARRLAVAQLQQPVVAAAPEQRIEGAPAVEFGPRVSAAPMAPGWNSEEGVATQAFGGGTDERGALPGTWPQAMFDLNEQRQDQLRRGYPSNPKPGQVGWDTEGDMLKYEEGMTEEEFQARLNGFESAESMRQWQEWVAADPERMRRYDPEGYAEWSTAKREEEMKRHAGGLIRKYGDQGHVMAKEYVASQREGRAPDSALFRSPAEQLRVDNRELLTRLSRGFAGNALSAVERRALGLPDGGPAPSPEEAAALARDALRSQDSRANYQGAIGGAAVSQGVTKDGTEKYADRFNRNIARRKAEEEADLELLRYQNLLGRAPTPIANANAFALAQDEGMDDLSRRALLNTLPGAEFGAEVDAANLQRATDLAGSAIRGLIGMTGLGEQQQDAGPVTPSYDDMQDLEGAGEWGNPAWEAYAEQIVDKKYSATRWFGNTSTFSDQEVVDAAADLIVQFPKMPEEEALRIMRNIQARREGNFTNPFSRIFY